MRNRNTEEKEEKKKKKKKKEEKEEEEKEKDEEKEENERKKKSRQLIRYLCCALPSNPRQRRFARRARSSDRWDCRASIARLDQLCE